MRGKGAFCTAAISDDERLYIQKCGLVLQRSILSAEVIVARSLEVDRLPAKYKWVLALKGCLLVTPSSLDGGAAIKFKAALHTPRTVFVSPGMAARRKPFLEFVSSIHMAIAPRSRWQFVYDGAEFKKAKRKRRPTPSLLGWIHSSEAAEYTGLKHVHVEDDFLTFVLAADALNCVRGHQQCGGTAAF